MFGFLEKKYCNSLLQRLLCYNNRITAPTICSGASSSIHA